MGLKTRSEGELDWLSYCVVDFRFSPLDLQIDALPESQSILAEPRILS
jgi:hypothetical protein